MKRKLIGILLGILAVFVLVGGTAWALYAHNTYVTELALYNGTEMNVEYGSLYVDPGAEASTHGTILYKTPWAEPIQVQGTVDTQKLGTYEISYSAQYKNNTQEAVRTVHVVDTKAPEIILTSEAGAFTFPGETYTEEGFTAVDNCDGDLTDLVKCREENGKVTYTVADSSGNETSVTREIHYDDPVAPEICLEGNEKMSVAVDSEFKEPGYSASDNCDGDLTDQVKVSGSVNTDLPGEYKLVYTVSDSYKNSAEKTRIVTVYKPKGPVAPNLPENPVGGVVYLTFDDGPSRHTDRLLDVLAKYNVKATFFVVNTPYISKVSRIAAEGHTVALHTATHVFSDVYASDEAYFEDLQTISDVVEGYTGQKSMLIRFPGGSSNTISRAYSKGIMTRLTQAVQEKGYHYFDWNVDSFDAGGARSSDEVFYHVVNGLARSSTSVVLQHDLHGFSVDAVERIIQWGLENGYTFQPLTVGSPECHHGVNN